MFNLLTPRLYLAGNQKPRTTTALDTTRTTQLPDKITVLKPRSPRHFPGPRVGWLVVLGLTALWDSISVYIGPPPIEGERGEKIAESKNAQTTPTRTYCQRNRPLPYYHPNCGTSRQNHGILKRTFAPSDHPRALGWRGLQMTGALLVLNQISLRLNSARYTSFHPSIYVYIVTRKRSIWIRCT